MPSHDPALCHPPKPLSHQLPPAVPSPCRSPRGDVPHPQKMATLSTSQPGALTSATPAGTARPRQEEAIRSFMCEGTLGGKAWKGPRKDIPSLAGKRPARLAGDGLLSVPVAGGIPWACVEGENLCVVFFFSSALSPGGAGGTSVVAVMRGSCPWCLHAGLALGAPSGFCLFALCAFSLAGEGCMS